MLNLEKHPYFQEYIDENTGVKSYFLKEKVAQMQQHFYFTNTSLTTDEKYLWIRCINAPAQFQNLAVVSMDSENPSIRNIPGAGYSGGGNLPTIVPGSSDVLFGCHDSIYRSDVHGNIEKVLSLDPKFLNHRIPDRMMSHASVTTDGEFIVLDFSLSGKTYLAVGNLKTGEIRVLNNFGRCYDHAMFCPTNPELILLDQDWWRDWHTGEYFPIDNRMWLMNTKGTMFEPVIPNSWYGRDGSEICHDFWALDGTLCWIDYRQGAFECNVDTREITHVWKRPMCHAHTTRDRKLWVADETPYAWKERPCRVIFYDRETNKEIDIFSALPCPKVERTGCYHLDPHPSFTEDGKYIISTVTLLDGNADVAITPVEPLLEICRKDGTIVND